MKIINKNRQEKGITLIALVITIIVLLILAGVSIATLTGENGILTQANEAKEKNAEGKDIENIKLAINESKMFQYQQEGKTEEAVLKDIIEKNTQKNVGISKKNEDGSYTVTVGGREYLVKGDNVIVKEHGVRDKQSVLVASTDNIIFENTITKQDIQSEYPNYSDYQIIGVSESETGEFKTSGEIQGKAGNLEIVGDLQQSTYTFALEKPMLGDETFFVKLLVDGEEKLQKLEVIQGDVVIYEENMFTCINATDTTNGYGVWEGVKGENYSNGSAMKIESNKLSNDAKIEFDFKGSKLELIFALDKATSQTIRNEVFKKENMQKVFSVSVTCDGFEDRGVVGSVEEIGYDLDSNIEHHVRLTMMYSKMFDWFDRGFGRIYLDAMRIYK